MSRQQANKSRLEKSRLGQTGPVAAVTHDIIPGKFNEQDWNNALEAEDNEDFACDLVKEVCNNAVATIYRDYLSRQLVPFTVALAKDAMTQIVEWRFLAHETGETEILEDVSWTEDAEPDSCTLDSWAQGAIPKRPADFITPASSRPLTPLLAVVEEEMNKIPSEDDKVEGSEEAVPATQAVLADEISPPASEDQPDTQAEEAATKKQQPTEPLQDRVFIPGWSRRKGPINFKPNRGRIKSPGLGLITETLYETEQKLLREEVAYLFSTAGKSSGPTVSALLKKKHVRIKDEEAQQGRPPGNRDVLYDDLGNVTRTIRIPSDQLPQHRVKVHCRVVDPDVEAANARLEAMKKGRRFVTSGPGPIPGSKMATNGLRSIDLSHQSMNGDQSQHLVSPLPPSLVDTIVLAPGVVLREGDQVKRGPRQKTQTDIQLEESLRLLRPLKSQAVRSNGHQQSNSAPIVSSTISIRDIIDPQSIVIKPLRDAKPIPPISAGN